jgi:hypothetical protein
MKPGIAQKFISAVLYMGLVITSVDGYALAIWNNITPTPDFSQVYDNVDCCYDNNNNYIYATWNTGLNDVFTAAYYDGNTWHDISPISGFGQAYIDFNCCYNSTDGFIYSTWNDKSTRNFKAAYYDGASWHDITPSSPNLGAVNESVTCCYGNNNVYAAWGASSTSSYAFSAAYYDGAIWHNISDPTLGDVYRNVYCCYDSSNNLLYATWTNTSNDFKSAYYDVNAVTPAWHPISSSITKVVHDVTCCYASASHRIYATWANNSSGLPFRAACFDGTNWNDITPTIPDLGGVIFNPVCCYDSDNDLVFATWGATGGSNTNFKAAYYDGNNWYDSTNLSPSIGSVANLVNCCYAGNSYRIYATWNDQSSNFQAAYYGFNMAGVQTSNNFEIVSEYFNTLSWQSPSPLTSSYLLKRNGVAIANLDSSATYYEDHNRTSSVADTYLLEALDTLGNILATASITIIGK